MLKPRITPCLLIQNKGLVKTTNFAKPQYIGDPINAVRIFNEKQADELIVLDIDATAQNREPNYEYISYLAAECRMPLCYGGGIKTRRQAEKIIGLGVEKVAISSALIESPSLVNEIATSLGSQSVVSVIDLKKKRFGNTFDIYTHNGKKKSKEEPIDFIRQVQEKGIGELVLNFIDYDGTMNGYPIKIIKSFKPYINVPLTVLGGASSLENISELIGEFGLVGASAGSLFIFKGKYRAVLINYPNSEQKINIITH